MLGDPEPDIGSAGDEGGVGKSLVERGERIEARGRGKEAVLIADEEVAVVIRKRRERRGSSVGGRGEPVGRRAVAGRERRGEDRPVAGTAAKIAGKLVAEAGRRRRDAGMIGGEEAHHDARRAKAALGAMVVDHRLLQRMQRLALGEILDRDQLGAVELAEQENAGVDRLVRQLAVAEPRQHHRAGAAIAFGAAFFRPLGAFIFAQPVKNGRPRRKPVERDFAPAKAEAQRVAGLRRLFLQVHHRSSKPRA